MPYCCRRCSQTHVDTNQNILLCRPALKMHWEVFRSLWISFHLSILQLSEWLLLSKDIFFPTFKTNWRQTTALHWHDCHWFCRHSFSSPVRNGSPFLFGESPSPLTSRLQCEPVHFGESYVFLVETPWQYPTINPNLDIAVSPSELRWSPDFNLFGKYWATGF